ncbi:hypothetical protein B0H14DRAFT_2599281 [Mycena olivaceomarginata]|nr:hypothetical protein B0H14DRAFT_2599281 [Mycena olivaceomarginata]
MHTSCKTRTPQQKMCPMIYLYWRPDENVIPPALYLSHLHRSPHLAAPAMATGGSVDCAGQQARLGTPLKRVVCRHMANAQPITIETTHDNYPVTSTGWGGIQETRLNTSVELREYTITELVQDFGMSVVHWDGRSPRPLVDREGCIIAMLGRHLN